MPITSQRNAICALAARSFAKGMVTTSLYTALSLRSCIFTRYAPFRYRLGRAPKHDLDERFAFLQPKIAQLRDMRSNNKT